jgi:hypothetical protein
MSLVSEWSTLARRLPDGWADAQVRLHLTDTATLDRAATLLASLQPVRAQDGVLAFRLAGDGSGPSTAQAERALALADREGIEGTLELGSTTAGAPASAPAPAAAEVPRRPVEQRLPETWDDALAALPADWSDLLGEIELGSSDYLERAALLLAPVNPRRDGDRLAFQFRCARTAGYGASVGMVRRCLERCDDDRIYGAVSVLRVLSDTRPVLTQGPVWQISGRTV